MHGEKEGDFVEIRWWGSVLLILVLVFTGNASGGNGTTIDFSKLSGFLPVLALMSEDIQEIDTESWLDPDYSAFYRTLFGKPYASGLANFLHKIFFRKKALVLTPNTILDSINAFNTRPYKKLEKEGSLSLQTLLVKEDDQVFIFGDLHGAFHSFVRILKRFYEQGLLDDSLTLTKKGVYFVFLGDYLNRSPFGFHLLTLLFHFAGRNPDQVFLLRGRQETDRHWESFLASRDFLKIMFDVRDESELPLAVEINNVFERLPQALILKHQATGELVVCAHNHIPRHTLAQPNVQAFLCGENRSGAWLNSGLAFQEFRDGSALWRLFSAPVPLYVRYGGLDRDAYCTLPVKESFARGSIACMYFARPEGNVLEEHIEEQRYSLAYGHELRSLEDLKILEKSQPYFLCSSGDLSATLRRTTQGSKNGVEACFLDANQAGGAHGFLFRVVFLDDQYVPVKMTENVRILQERYKTDALLVPQGSAPIQELMPQIQSGKFFVFFPYTGSAAFRKPEIVSMIHVRQPYFDETERLFDHFQERYHAKKIALVYQDDAFGSPIALNLKAYAAKHYFGMRMELVPFARGQLSMAQQLKQLKKINPEAIGFFITNPAQISTIVTDLGINTFVGKHIFALAFEEFFVEVAERWGVRAMFSSSFQPPRLQQGTLMQEFCQLMCRYHYPLSIPAYEAFFGARLFLEGFKRASEPITSQKILTAIEQMSGELFYGQALDFKPEIRGFVLPVWVFEEDGSVSRLPARTT